MLTKRIIPCLDIKDGQTVKGVNFINIKSVGDPVELAYKYAQEGADELVFLDISATEERRRTLLPLVRKIAQRIDIPFTVGGGVASVADVEQLLRNGADKIAINSAAIKNPQLITDIAKQFGSQCVVLAVDAKFVDGQWKVHLMGGKTPTALNLHDWVVEAVKLGAGEILFTSMDHDGTKAGFAVETLEELCQLVNVPIIASGGAGNKEHFLDLFQNTAVDAALAASIFHYNEVPVPELKGYLKENNIAIRTV